ncbi:MAG: YARHG domain-containing protein [Muribaculaceae bacterium]|nr:YARHG domain-containing protein [Muribaculaceae bacterium]
MKISPCHDRCCRLLILSLVLLTALLPVPSHAQRRVYSRMYLDDRDMATYLNSEIADWTASREKPLKVLSTAKYLLKDDSQLWTNGVGIYETFYDNDDRLVYFSPIMQSDIPEDVIAIKPLKVKGRNLVLSDRLNVRVSVEQIAGHILLVGRNAQNHPVMVLLNITNDQRNDGTWTSLAQYLVMGNYTLPDGHNAVFGPKCPFYTGSEYDTDPGILNGYYINRVFKSMDILYGSRRVSRGDPSSPNWGKMPGGGGAAAIMGPMEWNIRFTVEGLQAVVVRDERFVEHMPAIGNEGDTVMLTKVQTPYQGLEGKWAFASVIPLTNKMLELFPKQVLTLMRAEIYARHGDTFRDPATQHYFDGQPWYKRSGKPVRLTDLERFNYLLIKQVESTMK